MRVLAVHPESIGDLLPRQRLYAALAAAGHELTLVVRASLAPQMPEMAPGARVLMLDDASADQNSAGEGESSELIAAARAMEPDVLLVGSEQTNLIEQRLTRALPAMRTIGAAPPPDEVDAVLRAIGGIDAAAATTGRPSNGIALDDAIADSDTAESADPRDHEIEALRQRVQELEAANARLAAAETAAPTAIPEPVARRLDDLSRQVASLEAELEQIRTDGFRWMLESGVGSTSAVTFSSERIEGLVSVVIPAYNAAAFLERCVESVWAQAGDGFETEILLCDDGSTDGTWELARQLRARSPVRMEVLTHPDRVNRGVSATRNLGLSAARGEFIALLDADDVWHSRKLAVQVRHMRAHPQANVVCSLGRNRDLSGGSVVGWNGNSTAGDYRHVLPPNDFSPPYTFEQLVRGDPIVNSTLLIRREAMEAVGGYPRMMAHQAEDWLVLAKLALLGPIDLIEEELIDYTVHPKSYTTQYIAQNFAYGSRIEFLYHLVHWMVRHPQYRERGEQLFRREYPRLVAVHAPAYKLIEDYCRYHSERRDPAEFEAYLSGVYAELEQLRLYAGERDWIMSLLRKIPGLRTAYGILRQMKMRR